MKYVDCRTVVVVALCLVAGGASAQDAIGPTNDASNAAAAAFSLGTLTLAGNVSAPAAVRTIAADFYGEADSADYYTFILRDEPIQATGASCFNYRRFLQADVETMPPAGLNVSVYLNANQTAGLDLHGAQQIALHEYIVDSCGSSGAYWIKVERVPGGPATAQYALKITSRREFLQPGITAISPTSGAVGTQVTITGGNLVPQVAFQGAAATIDSFTPDTIRTSVPPGATTGPVTVLSAVSPQVFTVSSRTSRVTDSTTLQIPGAQSTLACCTVKANPSLAGRLGRIVVTFPSSAVPTGTRVVVLKDGQEIQGDYGSQSWDLLPGSYDLSVSGKIVKNVTVQARSDTNVRVGVLRVTAGSATRVEVLDGGTAIAGTYGEQLVGLPVGTYGLRISGQTESFTIDEGQVTDF